MATTNGNNFRNNWTTKSPFGCWSCNINRHLLLHFGYSCVSFVNTTPSNDQGYEIILFSLHLIVLIVSCFSMLDLKHAFFVNTLLQWSSFVLRILLGHGIHRYTCRVESLHVLFSLYIQFKFTSPSSCTTNWSHRFYSWTIVPFNFNHALTKLYFLVNYSSKWLCKVVIMDFFLFIHSHAWCKTCGIICTYINPRVGFVIRQSLK